MWDAYERLEIDFEEQDHPLSNDDLRRIAAQLPPIPQSWYEEDMTGLFGESDPFAEED